MNAGRSAVPGWPVLGLALLLAGCAFPGRRLPPWDLTSPGWTISEMSAAWRPASDSPELAGELLVARNTDGSRLVQFAKQGVPVVVARSGPSGWEIRSPFRSASAAGRGAAPKSIVWFRATAPKELPEAPEGWKAAASEQGGWILERPETGERLEVAP